MKIRKNKKGFTVVELVIVIAIIGVLSAVLIPVFMNLTQKANEASDQSLVKNLNTVLAIAENEPGYEKSENPSDMFKVLERKGYIGETLIKDHKSDKKILYNLPKNRFLFEENKNSSEFNGSNPEDFWTFGLTPDTTGYSTFLYNEYNSTDPIVISSGLDVGLNDELTDITYRRGSTTPVRKSVIRTNGGVLHVEAPIDNVKHYGYVDTVEIKSISPNSYYEYGQTYLIDITNGRVVITNNKSTDVAAIYLTASEDNYDGIILAAQTGASLPGVIQRQGVSDPEEGHSKLIATIQEVDASGNPDTSKTEHIYLYGSSTAKEGTKNYVGVSDLGTMLLEAPVDSTEPGVTDEIKESKVEDNKDVTKGKGIAESFDQEGEDTYLIKTKEELLRFAYMVNSGGSTLNKTFKLMNDIDLEGMDWTPIGYLSADDTTNGKAGIVSNHTLNIEHSKAFQGTFDGNNRTISNLKISHPYGDGKLGIGLFGLVVGSAPNPQYHGSNKADTYVYSNGVLDETKFNNSNYSAVIKNLTVDVANITTGDTEYHTGTICGIAYNACIDNCDVSNLTMSVAYYAGGVAGSIGDSVIKGSDVTSGTIDAGAHEIGGVVGVLEAWFKDSTSHSMVLNCSNRASVKGQTQIGGIVGYAQSGRSGIIAKCTNYGDVSLVETDYSHHTAGGICGWGTSVCLYFQCTNNGNVTGYSHAIGEASATNSGVHVGGITVNQANSQIVSCVNNGELSGYANYMGGIVSATVTEATVTILNCGSNGEFNNSYTSGFTGKYYGKAGVTTNVTITGTVDSLDMVQDYVNSLGTASIDLTSLNVTNKEGVLVIPSSCTTLTVNTNVCEKISLAGGRSSLIKIYAPGVDVVLDQDDTNEIMLYEAKNVSIQSGTTLNVLSIANVEKTYNSGTIAEVLFFVRNESSDAPLTTYFENNGIIGPSSTNSVIRFVAPNAAANHRGCLHARIYIVNNGVITANNENAINMASDGINDTIANIHFNSGCELNSNKRMGILSGSTNYLNISYHSSFKDTHGTEPPSVKPGPSARTISGDSAHYTITENDTPNYNFDFE